MSRIELLDHLKEIDPYEGIITIIDITSGEEKKIMSDFMNGIAWNLPEDYFLYFVKNVKINANDDERVISISKL